MRRRTTLFAGAWALAGAISAGPAAAGLATPPETTITKAPKVVHTRSATFAFESDDPAAKFRCQVDNTASFNCPSPKKLIELDQGRHKFRVTAYIGSFTTGVLDPTPALARFRVDLGD